MCGMARRAGVDAALVHHYFGSKDELFTESGVTAQHLPLVARALADVSRDDAAETVVRTVLAVWGRMDGRGGLRAVIASVVRSEVARDLLHELVLRRLPDHLRGDERRPSPGVRGCEAESCRSARPWTR